MRTNINLASQPYEDAQEYAVYYGSIVFLLMIVTAALIWFTFHSVRRTSDLTRQINHVKGQIAALDREKANAEQMLAMPQNHGTVAKSEYLNTIFARKAFSWTLVFSDMEKIMPPGLRVLSITPALDDQNQLQVHIMVGGESRDRAIELVQNLEKTPRFRNVQLRSDQMNLETPGSSVQGGTTAETRDPIRFDILAYYSPSVQNTIASASTVAVAPSDENATIAQKGDKQ